MPEQPRGRDFRPKKASNGRNGGPPEVGDGMASHYRELVERVPAVLYVDRSDGPSSAFYVNPRGETLLGYAREEWIEDPGLWVKTLHPEDRGRVLAAHDRARRSGGRFEAEYRLVARDGSVVWVRDEAAPVGNGGRGPGRRAGMLLDITDRKRFEQRLQKSEERLRMVARTTGEAIWDNDLLTGRQEWDGATEALFGYPPHAGRSGAWWEERIHPEDRQRVLSGLRAVLGGGGDAWEEEYRFRRANGSYASVQDRGRVVRAPGGEPVRMVGSMKDVTERRRHEEELKRSEELFRTTFEAAAVGMAHLSPDGRWLRINDKLCEISGYPRSELLGMSYVDLALPEDIAPGEERVRRLLSGETGPYSLERRYVRKDGSRVWVKLFVSLTRKPSGEPDYLICVAEDITSRKLAELVPEPLTAREMEVLRHVVAARTNRQIAVLLFLSKGTVKLELQHIIAKLGVEDRSQAVTRAVEIGLVLPPRRPTAPEASGEF